MRYPSAIGFVTFDFFGSHFFVSFVILSGRGRRVFRGARRRHAAWPRRAWRLRRTGCRRATGVGSTSTRMEHYRTRYDRARPIDHPPLTRLQRRAILFYQAPPRTRSCTRRARPGPALYTTMGVILDSADTTSSAMTTQLREQLSSATATHLKALRLDLIALHSLPYNLGRRTFRRLAK